MTQPVFPLEIKTLVICELSPYDSVYGFRHAIRNDLKKAAYFRDLGTVCLVWPDTIAIVRQIIFETISLRSNDHKIDSSLRNLCQALENDPNLSTFVRRLEFIGLNTRRIDGVSPFIPTASRPLFLSFLSFIPKMHRLEYLLLNNMRFHANNSLELLNDLRALEKSFVEHINLKDITFSMSAFNTFLGYWNDKELGMLTIDGIFLIPDSSYRSDPMDVLEEESNDSDEESDHDSDEDLDEDDTWTDSEVERPSLWMSELHLTSSGPDMSTLLDFLGHKEWSPLERVHHMHLNARGCTMTATTVIQINKLIRRFKLSYLDSTFTNYANGTLPVLYVAGLEIANMFLRISGRFAPARYDENYFHWYVGSLAAVPPKSRLRKFALQLHVYVSSSLGARNLGSQGVWGMLDEVLSGENLQLDTVTIHVSLQPSPHGARTPALVQKLQTWLTEICFPKVTAKYFKGNQEEIEGREMSALIVKYSEAE